MSFDKSLKVLNYARDNNGFVELFTELDHSFVAGDKVFIVGGVYDNTNELSYASSYNNLSPAEFNPYAQFSAGYTVRSVNYPENAFTIDVPSTAPMYYPHGVLNNILGNPQDAVNIAYNSYFPTPDLYKNVYVSRTSFINGRFRRGTVVNGIFGNDYNKIILNKHHNFATSAVQSDVQITHIAAKNASISKCVISSKTDFQSPASNKMMVVEDNNINPGPNPHGLATLFIDANNDSWGYSSYERFKIYEDSTIYNGDFNNPRDSFLVLFNTHVMRAKLGGKEPIETNGNKLEYDGFYTGVTGVQSGYLGNFTNLLFVGFSDFGDASQSTIDTFIDLKPSSVVWGANPGEVVFNVEYDVLANKNWVGPFFLGGCYISGINPIIPAAIPPNQPEYYDNLQRFDITQSYGSLVSTTYTHGNISSAQITLSVFNLIPNWATWILNFTPADFDFSKAKISFMALDNIRINGNTTVSGVINSPGGNTYITGNGVSVKEGMFVNMTFHASTQFLGTNPGESILLLSCRQMFQSDVSTNAVFNWTTIEQQDNGYNVTPFKGDFHDCRLYSGTLHNSIIDNTFVGEYNSPIAQYFGYTNMPNVYLYNDVVSGNTRIDAAIKWDRIQFNGTPDAAVNNYPAQAYVIESSKLGFRKTPWKTGPISIAPIASTMPAPDFNKLEGSQSLFVYNSQTVVELPFISFSVAPYRDLYYHVPSLQNIIFPIDATKYYSIIDHGGMYYTGGNWQTDNNKLRSDVLFSNFLDNPNFPTPTLLQMITDRYSHNVIGATNKFPGVDPLIAVPSDIREVDTNFEFQFGNYWNDVRPREQSDITINVYDILPTMVSGQPDPAYIHNNNRFLKLTDVSFLTDIDNIYPGVVAIPDGTYSLSFRHFGPVEELCIMIPFVGLTCVPVPTADVVACFIEVERVIVTYYNNLNVETQIDIHDVNYCPEVPGYAIGGPEYAYDLLAAGIAYPQDFPILKSPYTPTNTIEFSKLTGDIIGDHCKIDVEYWITWYNAFQPYYPTSDNLPFTGFNGGYREKKVDTYFFS